MDSVPPLLQVLILAALALFVGLTIAARLSPALGARMFDSRREPASTSHLLEYTVVPGIFLIGGAVAVIRSWDAGTPWLGTWSGWKMFGVIGLATFSFAAVVAAHTLKVDMSDARRASAWLPFGLMVCGLAAMIGFVILIA